MFTQYIPSPIGTIRAVSDGTTITTIERVAKARISKPDALTKLFASELSLYFLGKIHRFTVPASAQGTDFQQSVWEAMKRIPFGETKTYAALAQDIGRPKAVRAVGSACGKNPLLIVQPCHRVIGRNGALGGFAAGIRAKNILLALEHVA